MNQTIEIPSHFICPISLQLMRDPVTLSTGISYDRDSIEKWLFTCKNDTCPVSKQIVLLDHQDEGNVMITPNHTLRRLIQSWCTLHASDGIERIPTPRQPPTVDRAYVMKLLSDAKRSTGLRYASLKKIRSILTDSSNHSAKIKKILQSAGVFGYAASLMTEECDREKEEALSILSFLENSNDEVNIKTILLRNVDVLLIIDSLIEFLRSGGSQSREQAIRLLLSIYKVSDPSLLGTAKVDLFFEIVNMIKDGSVSLTATKSALKLLVELNPWGRNRVKAVECGSVSALLEVLLDVGSGRRVNEIALVALDQLCGCAEGRADLVGHGAGLAVVSKKILRVSHAGSDRAVRILSWISRYAASGKVVAEMAEVGVVAKLCLVVQMDCEVRTKEKAREILRMHSRVWKMSPCIPSHLFASIP